MFVKIRYLIRSQDQLEAPWSTERETIYDCMRASIGNELPEHPKAVAEKAVLVLDVGKQDERTVDILFPVTDGQRTEIYYMNNEGKTIDKYIY